MGLEKKSACYIIDSVNSMLCFAVLGRRMWARHVKNNALRKKE
jgi:hypothetical protein